MTAGTAEKVWRLLDKRVTPAAGAVLTYLAYRAHYEDKLENPPLKEGALSTT